MYCYVCTVHPVCFNHHALYIYIFYINNIYVIITPTCFDTFVSSLWSSKVVNR